MALASSAVRSVAPQKIVVRIDEIDVVNRVCHARDKTNVLIQVSFRDAPGGVLQIPAQNERWTVTRIGHGPWYLDKKLDSHDDHTWVEENMHPGDTRLSTDNTLFIEAEAIQINGIPFGYMTYASFTTDGTTESYTLPETPVQMPMAFINGLLINPSTFVINGSSLIFATAPPSGTLVVYYQTRP